MKCQGENGFAGDAFALTSASGILLKPDKAWPDRGPASRPALWGRAAPAPARLGAARGPPPDFGAGEFADLLQEKRPGASLHSSPLPGESCSLAELTQIARTVPLWGGFDTTVEPGQRRSRARQRVAKRPLPLRDPGGHWPAPAELAGSRSGCAFGDPLVTLEGWLAFVYSLF